MHKQSEGINICFNNKMLAKRASQTSRAAPKCSQWKTLKRKLRDVTPSKTHRQTHVYLSIFPTWLQLY